MTGGDPISQPVLNTPYERPKQYWELGIDNRALNRTAEGRRPSIALLPVPKSRENVVEQPVLPLGPENFNATVNAIRDFVDAWRDDGYWAPRPCPAASCITGAARRTCPGCSSPRSRRWRR